MKFSGLILTLFILCSFGVFSQEKYTKHVVKNGETISEISEKYQVKVTEIYSLNPGSKKKIKAQSVLLIPNPSYKSTTKTSTKIDQLNKIEHTIVANETLFGIAKQYNVSINEICNANPTLQKDKIKIGQQMLIPIKEYKNEGHFSENKNVIIENSIPTINKEIVVVELSKEESKGQLISRVILPNETKYGIAKEYGITIKELEKQNPEIINNFPVGYKLTITRVKDSSENSIPNGKQLSVANHAADSLYLNSNNELIEQLIEKATEKIGTKYRSGGVTNEGFDCSGLMFNTFSNFDIVLPRSSIEQSKQGLKIKAIQAKKGDLIFFKTNGKGHINHVGMIVEVSAEEIKFIHSTNHKGVIISSTKEAYYEKNLVQVNRIL